MKNLRDVVGLPVIELTEGKSLGRAHSLVVDTAARRVAALEAGERSLLKSKTTLIPFDKLRGIGSDAITVAAFPETPEAQEDPALAALAEKRLTGAKAVTAGGSLAGTVEDFSFDPATGYLAELTVAPDKGKKLLALPMETVENIGKDYVILREDYLSRARDLDPKHPDGGGVMPALEAKAVNFALGREAGHDVFDDDGRPVIRKGETVTKDTVEAARAGNRLTQLLIAAGVGEFLDGVDFTREKLDAGGKKLLEAQRAIRERSREWLSQKLDEDRPAPAMELRDLWRLLRGRLIRGGRDLEEATRQKMREYVPGKKAAEAVHDREGRLLIARGRTITLETLEEADKAGRLTQLFLSAAAGDVQATLEPAAARIREVLDGGRRHE